MNGKPIVIGFTIFWMLINSNEQKGMAFDHNFGYYFTLFSSLLKKGKKKRTMNIKNRGQKSCLSARSIQIISNFFLR